MMNATDVLGESFPEGAKDTKLNLDAVLTGESSLSTAQRWLVALATAFNSRQQELIDALLSDAKERTSVQVIDDAEAVATLMTMNNVFYRFRHLVGKDTYAQLPARLRMNRLAKPATNKADFELASLAVSAVNGCETCVRAHEKAVIEAGLSEQQVHDAVRIAAVVHAAATASMLSAFV